MKEQTPRRQPGFDRSHAVIREITEAIQAAIDGQCVAERLGQIRRSQVQSVLEHQRFPSVACGEPRAECDDGIDQCCHLVLLSGPCENGHREDDVPVRMPCQGLDFRRSMTQLPVADGPSEY
ncbi:hypothetical protein [Planctomicrobium piriforme]|uniref:hypothetical protein n=1 Tax=Planctomicrobium piriforme TaxID=1576369 RepID=UPI00111339A1|nr:hypothetical protein [Planctomicrobium piriforme]